MNNSGETGTTKENIHDWLKPNEGDPGFQLLTEEEIAADVIKDWDPVTSVRYDI
jgi:hypothetical protein